MARGKTAGTQRERAVLKVLRDEGWFAFRTPASLGVCDIVALRWGDRPLMIEVKSTAKGPYEHFGPAERAELLAAARLAGARAELVWWPVYGKPAWIPSVKWPK